MKLYTVTVNTGLGWFRIETKAHNEIHLDNKLKHLTVLGYKIINSKAV
jgi:hypothetical protein